MNQLDCLIADNTCALIFSESICVRPYSYFYLVINGRCSVPPIVVSLIVGSLEICSVQTNLVRCRQALIV